MKKHLLRLLCMAFVLSLCLPMAACDMEFGGLVGELLADMDNVKEEIPLDEWQSDYKVEDILPDVETAWNSGWDEVFTEEISTEIYTEVDTYVDWVPDYTDTPTSELPEDLPPEPIKVISAFGWDQLGKSDQYGEIHENVFFGGDTYFSWEKDPIANIGLQDTSLFIFGWVAFYSETEGTVGYSIDGKEPVYNADFTYPAEQGVQDFVKANIPGGASACRMKFNIPVSDLSAGEHTVQLIAKDPEGNEELIKEFTLIRELPFVEKGDSSTTFFAWSFDSFYVDGKLYFAEDGNAESRLNDLNNCVKFAHDEYPEQIEFRGWTSFTDHKASTFGYYILGTSDEIIYDSKFVLERQDLELAGIPNGSGFWIRVPIGNLARFNSYRIGIVEKLENGTVVLLYELTIEL